MADKKTINAKGEGSFKINENGTVTHRKCVGYKLNGRRKTLTVTAATKTACIREMKKKEKAWHQEQESMSITNYDSITDLCERHLQYQIENKDLKPKSIDRRECTIRNQIAPYDIGMKQIHIITAEDIETHINELINMGELKESSITKTLDVLNAAFEWAVRRGDLYKNPVHLVKADLKKKLTKLSQKDADEADVNVLSADEVDIFVKEALSLWKNGKEKYIAANYLLLLLYTGMRVGEMLGLQWEDWDGEFLTIDNSISMAKNRDKKNDSENNYIPIEGTTKNQKARIIQLNKEAKWVLQRIKNDSRYVGEHDRIAVTRTGELHTASNLEHRFSVILKNAKIGDIKGGLHVLRRTFATTMYEQGARVEEIAAYIGDLESTTRKYYIAIRKKVTVDGTTKQVVKLPDLTKNDASVA